MFNQYPYINLTDLNLDYIFNQIKEMAYKVDNFVSINAIKYADPIQWDITSQYEKNTIVIDPQTGTAYISVQPVPSGVALNRTDYWTVVFDLGSFVTRAAKNFTVNYEEDTTTTATFSTTAGEWLIWGDTLYVAKVNITAGDSYVVDGNIERITVEEVKNNLITIIDGYYDTITGIIGELSDLTTTDKDSIVDAINSIITERGALANLTTTDKDSIVNAVNSIITERGALANLTTTDKDSIVDAINEVHTNLNTEITNRTVRDFKTIYDYGYESGNDITTYVQAFIDDNNASELYIYMDGSYTIDTLDLTNISNAISGIKHFNKSANTILSGAGAIQLNIATSSMETAAIDSKYSVADNPYSTRFVRNSDVVHTPNGNTQMNVSFIDNILNASDGYYHWNVFAQTNIASNTSGEDAAGYFQVNVNNDNENWGLAIENILNVSDETHNTRGIEVSLTGNSGVSQNGGKRIGIHLVTNTTGIGFNADYGILFSSHSNGTGFNRLLQIANGYSEYLLCGESNYTCVYGIDLSDCTVQAAAIHLGKSGGHCIQFDEFVAVEEDQSGVEVLAIKHGSDKLGITTNTSATATNIIKYLDVTHNGTAYKIPLYQ